MKKEMYEAPDMEIVEIDTADVITTSPGDSEYGCWVPPSLGVCSTDGNNTYGTNDGSVGGPD